MTIETMRAFFGWCAVINMGLMLWWVLFFLLAHDWMYRYHGKWFRMPEERFNAIHYAGMMFFKLSIFIFNIVPYFALQILS